MPVDGALAEKGLTKEHLAAVISLVDRRDQLNELMGAHGGHLDDLGLGHKLFETVFDAKQLMKLLPHFMILSSFLM